MRHSEISHTPNARVEEISRHYAHYLYPFLLDFLIRYRLAQLDDYTLFKKTISPPRTKPFDIAQDSLSLSARAIERLHRWNLGIRVVE